jgi:oxygen-independent coproporphyrinogen-3 oxidase
MIDAINREIVLCEPFADPAEKISTIYFGGGTPSLLSEAELNAILATLHKKFQIEKEAEITLEANPDNINRYTLLQWKHAGINRLSVGIQSFSEEELKWMNRAHTAAESLECIGQIADAGFTNFSVDLIYGSPLLSNEDFKKNVDIIFNKQVPHISCYALTVEPKTALAAMIRQKNALSVSNEKQSEQFLLLMHWMRQAGYEHYEISNFSQPGKRSRHNSSYWQGKPYYGFGPSAHSFNGIDNRRWNIANNALYMQSIHKGLIPFTEEILTPVQQINEYIMISLRTTEGMDTEKVATDFGEHVKHELSKRAEKYIRAGSMEIHKNYLRLTDEGKLLADGIAADLFSDASSL